MSGDFCRDCEEGIVPEKTVILCESCLGKRNAAALFKEGEAYSAGEKAVAALMKKCDEMKLERDLVREGCAEFEEECNTLRFQLKTLGEILGDPIGGDFASLEQAATEVRNERDELGGLDLTEKKELSDKIEQMENRLEEARELYRQLEERLALADSLAEVVKESAIPNLKALGKDKWGPDWNAETFVPINFTTSALHAYREGKQPHVVNNPPLIGGLQEAIDNRDAALVQSYRRTIATIKSFAGDEATASGCDHLRAAWEANKESEQPEPRCPIYKFMTKPFPYAKGGVFKSPTVLVRTVESTPGAAESLPCGSVPCVVVPIKFPSGTATPTEGETVKCAVCGIMFHTELVITMDDVGGPICCRCREKDMEISEAECYPHKRCPDCLGTGIPTTHLDNVNPPVCSRCKGRGILNDDLEAFDDALEDQN